MSSSQASAPSSSRHLALMGLLGVVTVMSLALVAFNVVERWQLEQEAKASVDQALGWYTNDDTPATRAATILYLDKNLNLYEDDEEPYTTVDVQVASRCAQTGVMDEPQRIDVDGATCYAEMSFNTWDYDEAHRVDRAFAIAYVNVTPQLNLVTTITTVFVAITFVGAVCAAAAGWRAGKRIEAAQESQKRFYENMSHELKTPLAAIRGYADGIQAGIMDPVTSAQAIGRETDRVSHMVEQILSISRLEAGAITAHPEAIEMSELVQDTLMPFEGIVRTRNLSVELDMLDGEVVVDADLFGHALENVFSNSFRHAEHTVRIAWDGKALSVWNDGTMPKQEDVAHLFDRYRTGRGGSTGIGLALASEVVSLHDWTIEAQLQDGGLSVVLTRP